MQKKVKAVIMFNWKNGAMGLYKRARKPTPYEIVINAEFTVDIPEIKPYELKANIKVTEAQVKNALLEEI
jgi:hypothetical protein